MDPAVDMLENLLALHVTASIRMLKDVESVLLTFRLRLPTLADLASRPIADAGPAIQPLSPKLLDRSQGCQRQPRDRGGAP